LSNLSNREAAKERRRQRIVQAARVLIQETGETGFSMRALAERAGVSLATPYNLLGSKQGVLAALLDADIEAYQTRLRRRGGDALDTMFLAVTLGRQFYSREPAFYRAVMSAVYASGRDYRHMFRGPRRLFWKGLVDDVIAAGFVSEAVQPEPFATNLVFIFFAAIMEWVSGEISLPEMESRVHYGFALSLLAVATPKRGGRSERGLGKYQRRVTRYARF
jgi:AcrR family transcriptional regulator